MTATLPLIGEDRRRFWDAIRASNLADMQSLLGQYGADIFTQRVGDISSGDTALFVAIRDSNPAFVEFMVDHGAPLDDKKPATLATPLIMSAIHGSPEKVALFLKHGASVHETDKGGRNALFYTAEHKESGSQMAEILCHHGADARTNTDALFEAIRRNNSELVSCLLEHGAPLDALNVLDKTPMTMARNYGFDSVVDVLQEHAKRLAQDAEIAEAHAQIRYIKKHFPVKLRLKKRAF